MSEGLDSQPITYPAQKTGFMPSFCPRTLTGNTPWYNTTLGIAMTLGRFAYVIPVLAMAGSFAAKKKAPASRGTFPTHGPLFIGLLLGVIVVLYLLQYFPALALGPVVEHLLLAAGKTF